MTKMTNRKTE